MNDGQRQSRTTTNRRVLVAGLAGAGIMGLASAGSALGQSLATSIPAKPIPMEVDVRHDLVYRAIDGQTLMLDAYLPSDDSAARAMVMFVHGGGWRHGNKGTEQARTICEDLVREGFVACSVDYRLAPEFIYPAAIDDLEAAVEWLRTPAQVASLGIEPTRIGAVGSSAGGNLVGLLGSRGSGPLTDGARIAAVVSMSGPMVLTTAALGFADAELQDADVVLEYLGCPDLQDCPITAEASPVTHVDPTDPPYLLINSDNENRVAEEQARVMSDTLGTAGVENQVIIWPGKEHAIKLYDHPEIRSAIMDFLHNYLDAPVATPAG